jgi:hypothetical protein
VVNGPSALMPARLRCCSQTETCCSRAVRPPRRSGQSRASTLHSIAALFSQEPCLGGVDFEAIGQALCFVRRQCLVETGWRVRVELVHNQHQHGGFPRRSCEQVLDKMRPVLTSAPVRNGPVPPTHQRFEGDKEAGDTVVQVDAVVALDLSRSGGPRFPHLSAELR